MKFGIGEIILIIVIAFVVLLVVRIIKMAQIPEKWRQYSEENNEDVSQKESSLSPHTRIILIGILITILGVVVLFSSLSLIKWVFWGPIGAMIAMLAGIVIVILARKR